MGLIRKSVVQEIGGWDEWCITEDAEASLRILKLGYKSIYINQAYGHGIMPLNFEGLKKQRFRWCFGGIQVLRKHWESLMPWAHWVDPTNQLTASQRYYYLLSSLQWFNESITMGFTMMLLISSIAIMLGWDTGVRPLAGSNCSGAAGIPCPWFGTIFMGAALQVETRLDAGFARDGQLLQPELGGDPGQHTGSHPTARCVPADIQVKRGLEPAAGADRHAMGNRDWHRLWFDRTIPGDQQASF